MKNTFIFVLLFIFLGCNKDESSIEHQRSFLELNELTGIWFRSTPIKFAALDGNPAFERGEYHIEVKFEENGKFEHRYVSLGFHENQNSTDSTSITIYGGTFELEDGFLSITNNSRTYIQIFDGDIIIRDTSINRNILSQHEYQWPKVEFSPDDLLKFTYHSISDIIGPNQISPGVHLREEFYARK